MSQAEDCVETGSTLFKICLSYELQLNAECGKEDKEYSQTGASMTFTSGETIPFFSPDVA